MPNVIGTIEYLQQLSLYEQERPYWCLITPREGFDRQAPPWQPRIWRSRRFHNYGYSRYARKAQSRHIWLSNSLAQSSQTTFKTKAHGDNYKRETEQLLEENSLMLDPEVINFWCPKAATLEVIDCLVIKLREDGRAFVMMLRGLSASERHCVRDY